MGSFGNHAIILPGGAAGVGPTQLTPFEMVGSVVVLEVVTSAAGTGTLSITAEVQTGTIGGVPHYGRVVAGDAPAVWTTTATNTAGTYRLALSGFTAADGDMVRLTYSLTAGVGNIMILAETFECEAAAGAVVGMAGPAPAPWGVLLNVATLAAGAYPATNYYPAAAGQLLADAEDVQFDVLATGTVTPSTARWRVEFQATPGGAWHDVSLAGYDVRTGAAGYASCESVGAVATSRLWHFDNAETYAWRLALDLVLAASGPVYAAWRKR